VKEEVRSTGIDSKLVLIFAVACGLAVANLYYFQPLLPLVASGLHVSAASAGLIVTATQVGFALGLLFVVPLGDLLNRRRLVPLLSLLAACGLIGAASSPEIGVLLGFCAVMGIGSVAAQILIPYAADLAADHQRGKVVGTVMSGLLLGILLARTVSGAIAQVAGWRSVEWIGAGAMVLLAGLLARTVPKENGSHRAASGYRSLLADTWRLFLSDRVVRWRCWFGGVSFAAFGALWTSIAFLLHGAPYHYSSLVIGLFGLVGASGATASSIAGRMGDRGHERLATGSLLTLWTAAFALMTLGSHGLAPLLVGIVAFDFGVQGVHVSNQYVIYHRHPEARSRVTSVYMTCYFVGGAVGSALSTIAWAHDRWSGVCILGVLLGLAGLGLWLYSIAVQHKR
jgi:predicted MFS family arabinose efflux permease